ncbi:F0F1 ATP synthase subunit B [Microdochium nivale]|nr:F0F1 ATP synthase subunit B [Microdochium nivale]
MSFLTRSAPRMAAAVRVAPVTVARPFSTTLPAYKTITETVKDTAATVNKKIGETLAGGIESGEQAAQKAKEAIPETTGQAKGQANEMAGQAKGKAHEVAGQAKGKANEVSGKL